MTILTGLILIVLLVWFWAWYSRQPFWRHPHWKVLDDRFNFTQAWRDRHP